MGYDTFSVKLDNVKVAEHMSLSYACLLAKAMFQEFYNEPNLSVTIVKEDKENDD